MAAWVPGVRGLISAPTPDMIDAAIATFEVLYPKPGERRAHALDD
jgi:hypothetical protein